MEIFFIHYKNPNRHSYIRTIYSGFDEPWETLYKCMLYTYHFLITLGYYNKIGITPDIPSLLPFYLNLSF